MHIAICDDNVADRKQMERLLNRESDKRKNNTGVFYINSFGNSEVLGKSPMQYDLFFIDMVTDTVNGYDFALDLVRKGVNAPIVLCISSIDYQKQYRQAEKAPANIYFLEKPIKTADLSLLLDQAITLRTEIPLMVELRSEQDTFYVDEQEIVCGCVKNEFCVEITLTDGRVLPISGSLTNLYDQILTFPSYLLLSKKAFINVNYISKCSFLKVTLQNGMVLNITPEQSRLLKRYHSALQINSNHNA